METDYQTFKLKLFVPVNWFLLKAGVLIIGPSVQYLQNLRYTLSSPILYMLLV